MSASPSPALMILPANPHAAYLAQRAAIDSAVARVLASGWYILGQEVAAFESEFAAWLGAKHVVGVANGTDAVVLALRACGIQPGDAVIAPAHTATATVAAIELAGAVPVLVDIDPATYTLNPELVRATIQARSGNERIKAMVVVHLYGHPADLDALLTIAHDADVRVIEDCAQAHGAAWKQRTVGTFGDAAAFSFYPTKNLGALGDGGAVATNDKLVTEKLRALREYGWTERYRSDIAGMNSRLDELQAAILRAKLPALAGDNERRRAIAARYDTTLRAANLPAPVVRAGATHVFHQYALTHPDRAAVQAGLRTAGVGSAVLYPYPIHGQPAYANRLPRGVGGLAESERVCREVLCLPVFPQLTEAEVERITAALTQALSTVTR